MLGRMASVTRLGGELSSPEAGTTATATTTATDPTSSSAPPSPSRTSDADREQAQHTSLIGLLLSKTTKIQKEARGRRYRELQEKLTISVEALTDFAVEEWPPRKVEEDLAPPEWMSGPTSSFGGGGGGDDDDVLNGVVASELLSAPIVEEEERKRMRRRLEDRGDGGLGDGDDGSRSSRGGGSGGGKNLGKKEDGVGGGGEDGEDTSLSSSDTPVDIRGVYEGGGGGAAAEAEGNSSGAAAAAEPPKLVEVDASAVQAQAHPKGEPAASGAAPKRGGGGGFGEVVASPVEDDPETREPMHDAVILSLEAYSMALSHPLKTPKMAELSLDCVTLLVKNRYVSGRAGGRAEARRIAEEAAAAARAAAARASMDGGVVGDGSGDGNGDDGGAAGPRKSLLQLVSESVTTCSESTSEVVQAAMSKCLLAMMTSPKCGVHEAPMLMAVRATFHVYLVAKTQTARDVAKSTLLDMLRSVFNRMEAYDAMSRADDGADGGDARAGGGAGAGAGADASAKGGKLEVEQQQQEATATGAAPDDKSLASAAAAGGDDRTVASGGAGPHPPPGAGPDHESFSAFASQFHTDSYLLFRALCKLSAKTLPEDSAATGYKVLQPFTSSSPVDPLALSSKVLSLELILAVFEHCGDAFRTGEKFIYAVQNYLCVSLLKNCMSNHTEVAYLSLKIFLLLVYKFKAHLKSEIEVFVANIFLRVLESPNSSYEQKSLVLEALRALCSDPVILTQLFLNYDCDFDAVNLYKDIVHHLTKLSGKSRRNQYNANVKDVSEDVFLSVAGLETLVVILRAFLKALGLPGGDDNLDLGEDGTQKGLRGNLKLDVGLALRDVDEAHKRDASESFSGLESEDVSVAAIDTKGPDAGGANDAASDDVAGQIVDAFDKKRTAQNNLETGAVKFTLSLKSGLQYFIDNGFLNLDAREVAHFFHEHKDMLDKTQIGEALGREPESKFVKGEEVEADHGGEGFFVRILHYYVDAMDFTGLEFDSAIRLFLSGFRLPGEAQKIDRIMEKFAERYTRQNDDVFPSADTAFILAFSVIMLNTDLHNPSIKPEKRMTVESFIRNNRGISVDGGDLPEDFLTGIFNRIKAEPFSLKEDDDAREKAAGANALEPSLFEAPNFFGASAEDRKREKFKKEREEMMAASELLFKKRSSKGAANKSASSHLTESISPSNVVKPMFDATWGPLIGTLSQVLETSEDENSIALCLIAFVYSIRVSSHSRMSLARDTFVSALAKFTTLGSIKEMKYKNIESIRTLLSIAIVDGDFLGESWGPVLQCVSQLGRLQLQASGLDSDDKFLANGNPQGDAGASPGGFFRQPTQAELTRAIEQNNGRAILAAVNEILIDKVFSSTVNLSVPSMYHFIEQLVAVSDSEISGDSKRGISDVSSTAKSTPQSGGQNIARSGHGNGGPRIFSMQRLVEVADYNMDIRPRLAWAKMWEMVGNHFAKIGCDENAMVSMYAIDALRQLGFKFLEKPELADFNFQRLFLRPFLDIMENPASREDIRELILRCVDNMIRSMSHNLRSGWKIFFSILTLSASDPSEKINTLGLAILQRLLDEHLDQLCRLTTFEDYSAENEFVTDKDTTDSEQMSGIQRRQRNANAEDFVGLCHASMSFVQTEESDSPLPIGLSMRALCHTACYADLIADGKVLPPVSGSQSNDPMAPGYTYTGLSEDEALEMVLWRPILDGLAAGMCSTAPSNSGGVGCLVQRGSVMTMRAILLRHGNVFSIPQWCVILRQVILPAIQIGAEYDASPVTKITSESPSVSSLDFLNDALPLPPAPDDEGLMKFAALAETDESAPSRPLGQAELLVEASFADLRHGGDGNLSNAHGLAKKDDVAGRNNIEQPFPDSWVATTAPVALGMLTDIFSEIVLANGKRGREALWPIILEQLQRWSIGFPLMKSILQSIRDSSDEDDSESIGSDAWRPCEALVRIGCRELYRIPMALINVLPTLKEEEAIEWPKLLCRSLSDTLSKNVTMERSLHEELVEAKLRSLGLDYPTSNGSANEEDQRITTPYGKGDVIMERVDHYFLEGGRKMSLPVSVVQLDNGAVLYRPSSEIQKVEDLQKLADEEMEENEKSKDCLHYIPDLKVRCIASHCLQQHLPAMINDFAHLVGKEELSGLLRALEESRIMSCKGSLDEDLAHAFQEALLSEWGGGVEEVESTLASVGGILHKGGAEMFFLTQQAGANKAIIHLLSLLYCHEAGNREFDWDTEAFAESLLLERMVDVLKKFLISEEENAEFIDPNVWRMSSESGGKIALYCTSFASVAVSILQTILAFNEDQFNRHKADLYPILCSLIRVHSEEIRGLVQDLFSRQVATIVGVEVK